VLEPEEPLRSARRAFLAGMAALADAVGSHCPPEKGLEFEWPDGVRFNAARVGGGRLGWPEDCREDDVPGWLVFGAALVAARLGVTDPGLTPDSTTLEEEGFAIEAGAIVESFARHLMNAFHLWAEESFDAVAERYLERLARKAGSTYSIDGNGDLLVRHHGQNSPERRALLPALLTPTWLDPATGGPRI
jgi:hypothetical protein